MGKAQTESEFRKTLSIDWHQLDHYVSVTLALDRRQKVIAATVQQHNYQTTYLLGKDLDLPGNRRLAFDVALRSNEMYPHQFGRTEHRAVSFLTPEGANYLIHGKDKPWMSGIDVTLGEVERDYQLKFLPQTDAFYRFMGKLGESRWIKGRDGPPGADFNTLPSLKPKAMAMVFFYRRTDDTEYMKLLQNWIESATFNPPTEVRARLIERFIEDSPLVDFPGNRIPNQPNDQE